MNRKKSSSANKKDEATSFGKWWESELLKRYGLKVGRVSKITKVSSSQIYKVRDNITPLSVLTAFKVEKLIGFSAEEQLIKQLDFKLAELRSKHEIDPLFEDPETQKKP